MAEKIICCIEKYESQMRAIWRETEYNFRTCHLNERETYMYWNELNFFPVFRLPLDHNQIIFTVLFYMLIRSDVLNQTD